MVGSVITTLRAKALPTMDFPTLATFFSGISFLFFGIACQVSPRMKSEFIRYGYDRQRPLTGVLQILGGAGLLLGYGYSPELAAFSAGGLGLLMILGFGVRLKIKDSFLQTLPAVAYAVLNLYLCYYFAIL